MTDILTDHAIRFVEDNREGPFFLYLPYNAPHTPLLVPDRYARPCRDQGLPERTALVYGMIASMALAIRALSRPGDTVMELAAVELLWLGSPPR